VKPIKEKAREKSANERGAQWLFTGASGHYIRVTGTYRAPDASMWIDCALVGAPGDRSV